MFGSDILEAAIGMVFLFLFMSTIASALREAFEAFLKERSVFLERGLGEMLRISDKKTLVDQFYKHPLISSLYKGRRGEDGVILPSYIPKESFSLALLDLTAGASEAGDLLSVTDLKSKLLLAKPPNDVQRVLLTALSAAGDDLADVRKHLETWYDGTMDRVTGWYARRSAVFLFVFGFGAAVALNVDSITVAKSLLVDRPLRQAVVAEAEGYVQRTSPRPPKTQDQARAGQAADAQPTASATADGKPPKSFEELRTEFNEIGFPTGWTIANGWLYPAPQACVRDTAAAYQCDTKGWYLVAAWALSLMGWLVTAIAIMLGAPFWFDLLNKLVSLRSALKPPEDKQKRDVAATPEPVQQGAPPDRGATTQPATQTG